MLADRVRMARKAGGQLVYMGRLADLYSKTRDNNGMRHGDNLIFGCRYTSETTWTIYDDTLTRQSPFSPYTPLSFNAMGYIDEYILYRGGRYRSSSNFGDTDAYDADMVRTRISNTEGLRHMSFAKTGNYALFAGGMASDNAATRWVGTIDNNLVKGSTTNWLQSARYNLVGTTNGDYAIFAGGDEHSTSRVAKVDAYNADLVRFILSDLTASRSYLAGGSTGEYAILAGGYPYSDVVDIYDLDCIRLTPTTLRTGRGYVAGASLPPYVIVAGGLSGVFYDDVDIFSNDLVRVEFEPLEVAAGYMCNASNKKFAVLAAGASSDGLNDKNAYAYKVS